MKDLRAYVSRRVIIETDTLTVEGIIERVTATTVELSQPVHLPEGAEPRPFDGLLIVPAERVAWVQVP